MSNESPLPKTEGAVATNAGQQLPQKQDLPELTDAEEANIHLLKIGQHVYINQLETFAKSPDIKRATFCAIVETVERMKPRDPMEEMLILQSIWTHARVAKLSLLANQQTGIQALRVVTEACDRATNAYCRQMLALAEYRRPPRSDAFMAIKQANLAQQQLVQNVEKPTSQKPGESNEKGFARSGDETPALPPHPKWSGFPAVGDSKHEAVEIHNRTANTEGKRAVKDERA
jgi:hypothetical protein